MEGRTIGESHRAQPTTSSFRLDHGIPSADRSKYEKVQGWPDWKNPYLLIKRDGIEVHYEGGNRQLVSLDALARTLVALPVSAWPYGRIIAVCENGLRSDGDTDLIERNTHGAEKVLRELGLEIDWWPSA